MLLTNGSLQNGTNVEDAGKTAETKSRKKNKAFPFKPSIHHRLLVRVAPAAAVVLRAFLACLVSL